MEEHDEDDVTIKDHGYRIEESEVMKRVKVKYRASFTKELSVEPFNIKKGIIYDAVMLLSHKCPHCISLTGMIKGQGLSTLFTQPCPMKKVLLRNEWKLSNLKIKRVDKYEPMEGTFKKSDPGIATLSKFELPQKTLEKGYYLLSVEYSDSLLTKIREIETLVNERCNLLEERITFIDISINPQYTYFYGAQSVPFFITKFTIQGERGIHESSPEDDIERMLFLSSDYNLIKHQKFQSKKTYDWNKVMKKTLKNNV